MLVIINFSCRLWLTGELSRNMRLIDLSNVHSNSQLYKSNDPVNVFGTTKIEAKQTES